MTLKKTMSRIVAFSLALLMASTATILTQPSAEAASIPSDTSATKYVSAYPISTASRQYTYKNAACTSRGNEWIDGTDLCQIQEYNAAYDSYTIKYSTSSGSKVRYVPRKYFSVSTSLTQVTATQKMTAYIRSSTSSKVFGSVYSGDVIYTCGTSGNMTQVIYKVDSTNTYKLAWVLTSALPSGNDDNNNSNTTTATNAWVKTNGGQLNMRATASSSGTVLAKLSNGTQVSLLQWGTWAKIQYNGTTGYVSSTYLTTVKPNDITTTFQAPMSGWYCTWRTPGSNMSWGSYNKNSSGRNYHLALDVYGTSGIVKATAAGTVAASGWNNANGNFVIIQHQLSGKTIYSFYAHLSSRTVSAGTTVSAGQQIGVAGSTGSAANAVHLHFSIVDTLKTNGSYYGYATSFSGNTCTYGGVTYYNPLYVINNNKLP